MKTKLTTEYIAWRSMRQRCYNINHKNYKEYGARGIKICERWSSFTAFIQDIGLKPSKDMSIDRIDNNGDYSPENCKWSTMTEQCRNRRSNRYITYKGETLTVTEWAVKANLRIGNLFKRLDRLGWSIEKSLTTPEHDLIVFKGKSMTKADWGRHLGGGRHLVGNRQKNGWTIERSLSKKKKKKVAS